MIRSCGLRPFSVILLLLALLALPVPAARAQGLDVRARYEEDLIGAALLRQHLRPEPDPEGKLIERVVIDASPVVLRGDFPLSRWVPWTLLNLLHVRTREYILRQELLFRVGEPYHADRVEESGRILRSFFILSVARLVAARGSAPDRVVVLVVTKDQWSLRLNTSFSLDQGRFDTLAFSFSEHNLAGRNKRVSLNFTMDPGRFIVGLSYTDPRVWGTRHAALASASVHLNRDTSQPEGTTVQLQVGRPLFSLRTQWAWQGQFTYDQGKARQFAGGDLYYRCFSPEGGLRVSWPRPCVGHQFAPLPYGAPAAALGAAVPLEEVVPEVFNYRRITGTLSGTRSFGVRNKVNLTAGYRITANDNTIGPELSGISTAARFAFAQSVLPRSEGAAGPFVSVDAYQASYVRLRNIETLALTEDFQIGPVLSAEARYANPNFGMNSHFLTLSASYRHRFFFADNLLTLDISGSLRVQEDVCPARLCPSGSPLVNEELYGSLREVSPRFGPLRLHLSGSLYLRAHDLSNTPLTLGLDNGLRGFTARAFRGNGRAAVHAEVRSVALNLWTIHVGGVVFYDGGGILHCESSQACSAAGVQAPQFFHDVNWHQDVGVGLRVLIPQFNRDVLRLDLAFPLEGPGAGYVPRFSAEFGQAF